MSHTVGLHILSARFSFLLLRLTSLFLPHSSSEKTQALHTELDSVQALRGQLEEVLARTRGMALALERAAEARSDFGGGDGPGVASRAEGGAH